MRYFTENITICFICVVEFKYQYLHLSVLTSFFYQDMNVSSTSIVVEQPTPIVDTDILKVKKDMPVIQVEKDVLENVGLYEAHGSADV